MAIVVRRELVSTLTALPDGLRAGLALRRSVQQHGRAFRLLVPLAEMLFLASNPNDFNMYVVSAQKLAGTEGILGLLVRPGYLYRYGSVEFSSIRPPLQLLAIPLYLLLPKRRAATTLLCLGTLQYAVWSQGAQVLRYTLFWLPGLSVVAAYGISHVLINTRDLDCYVPIGPERRLSGWLARFEAGRSGYLEPVATNEASTLYRVLP